VILIIAYGNSLRSDDAAGLRLAEIIEQACAAQQLAVEKITVHQLLPELAPEMARPTVDAVLFVDTLFVDTQAVPPQQTEPAVQIQPLVTGAASPGVGHHLTPAALLTYAGLLYGRQPPAWLVTAPGVDFSHGQGLSPTAQRALAAAGPAIARLVTQLDSAPKILG